MWVRRGRCGGFGGRTMTEVADDDKFLAALNGAGWNPGRNTSTEEAEAAWMERGYAPSPSGVAFVSEFDGLTLMYPKHPSIGGERELKLDAVTATRSLHPDLARVYEGRVNEALVPVGMAASHHLTLLISESGKLYGGYDSFLALYGDTGMAGIRNIYQRIKGVKVPLSLGEAAASPGPDHWRSYESTCSPPRPDRRSSRQTRAGRSVPFKHPERRRQSSRLPGGLRRRWRR